MTQSPVAIRLADPADVPEMTRMLRASITELCGADHGGRAEPLALWLDNKTVENIEAWVRDPGNVMLVAIVGHAIASVGGLRKDGHINLNYVSPAHRFGGVSKAMLAALEREAVELGLDTIELESTTTAHRLYLAAGYADAGPAESKHGLTVFPMRKRLAGAMQRSATQSADGE